MACLFTEGFDKYGGLNSNTNGVAALLTAGEWTAFGAGVFSIVAGLSATGQALQVAPNSAFPLSKTLSASYSRLIGGVRFSTNLGNNNAGIGFLDNGTAQCCITVTGGVGTISVRNGLVTGTALATSTATVTASSTHYLEWDISFGNSASFQVWLDGQLIINSTGDTTTTANNTANQLAFFGAPGSAHTIIYDDLYLFDGTGTVNNAVLLNSPRIETTFPASDSAVQFAVGASVLGSPAIRTTGSSSFGLSNILFLRRFTPAVAATINSISIIPNTTGAASCRPVIYSDNSGTAGTLMSTGTTITGTTASATLTMPLTTPQFLSANVQYWLGFMTDTNLIYWLSDSSNTGYRASVTFTSGAPSTAPAMISGIINVAVWGTLTGVIGNNWYQSAQQPPLGSYSYVFDATVGDEDLYSFAPLTTTPANIHAIAVKGYIAKSDVGTRTVSLRLKSSTTDSGGSITGQAPGTTFGWLGSYFATDPATGAAWGLPALNAATSGMKIDA